jgi:hypothetical protein
LLKGPDSDLTTHAAASASVTFKVIATGGMRLKVDATEIDLLTASSVDNTMTVTLVKDAYAPIEIDYLPGSSASFQLLWKYGTANPIQNYHVVPPSYMHAILLSSDSQRTVSVTPAAPSTMSVATFSEGIVSGAADMITIQVMDAYGNAYTSSPSDATTTYTFEATQATTNNDGTVFSASSDKLDGTFTISFNFVTDGVKQITVKINDGTTATELANSPFTIVVAPGV